MQTYLSHPKRIEKNHTSYTLGQLLGSGQFGKVYKALNHKTSQTVAIKVIRRHKFQKNDKLKKLLERQIDILQSFTHENVIKFIDIIQEKQEVYIVYEYCQGGTLQDRILLSQQQLMPFLHQIAEALFAAERKAIIHRDIKPANILFKNGKIKIADWGFSRFLTPGQTTCSFIGSPAYMAPEILKNQEYSSKADIWSFGIVLFEAITGQIPWKSGKVSSLCDEIQQKKARFPKNIKISRFLQSLILKMLTVEQANRISCAQIIDLIKPESPARNILVKDNQDLKIQSCVFFLEVVQWGRKQILQTEQFCQFIHLIEKNLKKTKHLRCSQRQINEVVEKQITVITSLRDKLIKKMGKMNLIRPDEQQNPECDWQQLIKRVLKNISISLQLVSKQTNNTSKLIEMNLFLDMIIFWQMPLEYLKQPFKAYLKEMQEYNRKVLFKLINYKLQFISKKYYE